MSAGIHCNNTVRGNGCCSDVHYVFFSSFCFSLISKHLSGVLETGHMHDSKVPVHQIKH